MMAAMPAMAQRSDASREWLAFVWSSVPGIALALATEARWVSQPVALSLFAISFVGLNLMHMGATWARVYVRPGWRANPMERLWVPALLIAGAVGFEAVGGGALLLIAQYFLSFHHALMQNYGLVRVSQKRSSRELDPRLDLAACLLLPGAALLYRATHIADRYSGAPLPAIPTLAVAIVAMAGLLALVSFAQREWRSYRRGEPVEPIGAGIVLGTNLLWSGVLLACSDPALPLYAFASGHYAQYLYFVWRRERQESPNPASWPFAHSTQRWLRASPVSYLVVLLAIAGGFTVCLTVASEGLRLAATANGWRPDDALAIPPWAAAMIGINLQHYWLDHRIWRAPKRVAALAYP